MQYNGPGFRNVGEGEGKMTKTHSEAERVLEHSSALGDRIKHLMSIHALPSLALKVHWRKVGPEKCVSSWRSRKRNL